MLDTPLILRPTCFERSYNIVSYVVLGFRWQCFWRVLLP